MGPLPALPARPVAVLVAALGLFAVTMAIATPAQAATATRYVATTGSDTGNDCTVATRPCLTIQYAVDQADPGDTVSVAKGTYAESVRVRESLTLVGAGTSGTGRTTVDGIGAGSDPSIWIDGTGTATPPTVAVRDLDVSGNSVSDGIRDDTANATIEDSVVSGNRNNGIAIESSSTPAGTASATISNVTVAGNGANVSGAGVLVLAGTAVISHSTIAGSGAAGVNVSAGSATIDSSTLDANVAAGLLVVNQAATARLTDSTVSNTVPFSQPGAPGPYGAGVLALPGATAGIANSTIAGNTGQGVLSQAATVTVDNSTIAGTKPPAAGSALPGGGVVVQNLAAAAAVRSAITSFGLKLAPAASAPTPHAAAPGVTLTGTAVAEQSGAPDCSGSVTDQGYNLDDDGSCALSATGSIDKGTAKLGTLGDHGGATQTLVPAKGSQLIDAIPPGSSACTTGANDQRGIARPQGPRCDIGAVEVAQPPIVITPATLPHGTVGTAYHVALSATGGLGAPYLFSLAAGSSLPPGLSLSKAGQITGTPTKAGTFPVTVSVDDPVLKAYTLVIAPVATSPSSPSGPPVGTATGPSVGTATGPTVGTATGPTLAATGSPVAPTVGVGGALVIGGLLLMWAAGTRRRDRHLN